MKLLSRYQQKGKHLYCSLKTLSLLLFLVFLLFFFLFACISTPKGDENSDSQTSENSESENNESEKPISETKTSLTNQENELIETDKTKTRNTSLHKDEPDSGNPSRTNVTTALTPEKLPTNEENIFIIFFYVGLFSFMYIAIVIRIIHHRQKK